MSTMAASSRTLVEAREQRQKKATALVAGLGLAATGLFLAQLVLGPVGLTVSETLGGLARWAGFRVEGSAQAAAIVASAAWRCSSAGRAASCAACASTRPLPLSLRSAASSARATMQQPQAEQLAMSKTELDSTPPTGFKLLPKLWS